MTQEPEPRMQPDSVDQNDTAETVGSLQPWEEPKLTFIEPTLTKHGRLEEVTSGFIGTFTP
jgi:hypothetical protein